MSDKVLRRNPYSDQSEMLTSKEEAKLYDQD